MDIKKLSLISDEQVNKFYNDSIMEEEAIDYASSSDWQTIAGFAAVATAASFGFI